MMISLIRLINIDVLMYVFDSSCSYCSIVNYSNFDLKHKLNHMSPYPILKVPHILAHVRYLFNLTLNFYKRIQLL